MDDRAESGVIAETLLVALALVLSAAFVVWYGHSASSSTSAPRSIGLSRDASSTATTATYTVNAIAAHDLKWGSLRVVIDGTTATYDSALTATPSFCVSDGTSACIATGSWSPSTTSVRAGQVVKFHDTSLSGRYVHIADTGANGLAASVQMP